MAGMAWPDQNPPAIDVLLHLNVPCAGGAPAYLEINKRFAEPATSRRWCGTPMRWPRADRSTTWCTPSGRCRGWVEVGLRRGRAAVVKRIWSENGPRRSMSKGAKAMVAACMFPEKEKGGRGKKASVKEGFPAYQLQDAQRSPHRHRARARPSRRGQERAAIPGRCLQDGAALEVERAVVMLPLRGC